jgi:beta-lactamase regulating signal transducer with metallopeptidase domain
MAYIIKVIVASLLFLGFYKLLLEREKMLKFNRLYLILTLVLSLAAPLFLIEIPQSISDDKFAINKLDFENIDNELFTNLNQGLKIEKPQNSQNETIDFQTVSQSQTSVKTKQVLPLQQIIFGIYIFITLIMIVKFIRNLLFIHQSVKRNQKRKSGKVTLVENGGESNIYSFMNFVFIPEKDFYQLKSELLKHETAHAEQLHSLDILLVELVKIFFWFNPAFYFYKKAIQLNHEFLADENVINSNIDIYEYQNLILKSLQSNFQIPIASNFNFIQTKKRLLMMTKKKNFVKTFALQWLSMPFVLMLIFIFSNKIYAKVQNSDLEKSVSKMMENSMMGKDTIPENQSIEEDFDVESIDIDGDTVIYKGNTKNRTGISDLKTDTLKLRELKKYFKSDEWKAEQEQIRKESEKARKESEVARKESEVARKESEIARKEGEKARKESEKARKESEVARKEGEIARKEGEIARKEGEIARAETRIGQKPTAEQMAKYQAYKAKVQADIKKKEAEIKIKAAELKANGMKNAKNQSQTSNYESFKQEMREFRENMNKIAKE